MKQYLIMLLRFIIVGALDLFALFYITFGTRGIAYNIYKPYVDELEYILGTIFILILTFLVYYFSKMNQGLYFPEIIIIVVNFTWLAIVLFS